MGLHIPGAYEELKALDYLMKDGEQSGRILREKINTDLLSETEARHVMTRCKLGWLLTLSVPMYYQMMARLEDHNEVEGWYEEKEIDGITIQERWHRIQDGGQKRLDEQSPDAVVPDYRIGWSM